MRHAMLGAGGIGGLIGAALANAGSEVVMLMRPRSLASYHGRLAVESAALGLFEADVPATTLLDRDVDVLWLATKATELEPALELAPPERVGGATVIPLLNGVDHVQLLRLRYRNVVAGAIRVESEQQGAGRVRQTSPFLRVELADAEPAAADLQAAGIDCRVNQHNWPRVWRLGGKNLGQTYRQMVAGYRLTGAVQIFRLTATGNAVAVRVSAYESTGLRCCALRYVVRRGEIVAGQTTPLPHSGC